jgi:hypothetical protein
VALAKKTALARRTVARAAPARKMVLARKMVPARRAVPARKTACARSNQSAIAVYLHIRQRQIMRLCGLMQELKNASVLPRRSFLAVRSGIGMVDETVPDMRVYKWRQGRNWRAAANGGSQCWFTQGTVVGVFHEVNVSTGRGCWWSS